MLPAAMGECYLAQRAQWRSPRDARQDRSGAPHYSNDAARSCDPRGSMGCNCQTGRRLGLAAATRSGHVEPSSLRKQHSKTFNTLAEEAAKRNGRTVRPFVLYALRHTFLTRLGQSGCDAWTLARIAGHSSITISARYVHPSEDAVLDAMSRLGGTKTGHSRE
jgi:hypothetical protein